MPDWLARVVRTAIQLSAAGVFTELFLQVAHDVPASYAPYIVIGSTLVVTFAQNIAEEEGWIKPRLKPASEPQERV